MTKKNESKSVPVGYISFPWKISFINDFYNSPLSTQQDRVENKLNLYLMMMMMLCLFHQSKLLDFVTLDIWCCILLTENVIEIMKFKYSVRIITNPCIHFKTEEKE